MALIIRPPWTRQPQWPAPLNPKLRAPTAVWTGSLWGVTRLVGEAPALLGGTLPTQVVTPQGYAASLTNSTGRIRLVSDADTIFPSVSSASIAVLRRSRDATSRNSTLFGYNGGSSERVQAHAPYSGDTLYWDFANSTSGSGGGRVSVSFTKTTAWETLVFVAGGGKGREVWRNGKRIASDTSATANRTTTSAAFHIGSSDGTNNCDSEDIALFVVSAVAWSDAECRDWCNNPWGATYAAIERRIWVPVSAAGGGQTVAIAQATETDTAQPVTAQLALALAIAQAAETDLAQPLTAAQQTAIAQVAETDAAQALSPYAVLQQAIAQAAESDTALALSSGGSVAIAQASEVDAAQAIQVAQALGIAQAAETDAAQALQAAQALGIAQATESDSAQALINSQSKAIAQAAEADEAQALTVSMPGALGQAVESDAAQPLTVGLRTALGQAQETNEAQAVVAIAGIGIGLTLEIDVAQPVTAALVGGEVVLGALSAHRLAMTARAGGRPAQLSYGRRRN